VLEYYVGDRAILTAIDSFYNPNPEDIDALFSGDAAEKSEDDYLISFLQQDDVPEPNELNRSIIF